LNKQPLSFYFRLPPLFIPKQDTNPQSKASVVPNAAFESLEHSATGATGAKDTVGPVSPESKSFFLPAEIFDLTALTSAFVASLAVAPMLAFSYDDIKSADQRYQAFWANRTGGLGDGPQEVSSSLATSTSSSLALCIVSLIASVVVRMGLYFAEQLATQSMLVVRRLLIPLEVCAILSLVTGLVVSTFAYYWSGWVVYGEDMVGNVKWTSTGVAVIVCLIAMFLYSVGVAIYIYRSGGPATPLKAGLLRNAPGA
jgi:hypothetical protein